MDRTPRLCKPLLPGYDIREVPISWFNRMMDMGNSSFRILRVAPSYFFVFLQIIWNTWRGRRSFVKKWDTPVETTYEMGTDSSVGSDDKGQHSSCPTGDCLKEKYSL